MSWVEKVAKLEAHRDAHEDRHERYENNLAGAFDKIDRQFEAGHERFDKIDKKLSEIKRDVTGPHAHDTNGNSVGSGTKRKDVVIRVGVAGIGGTALAAAIILAERFAGG